MLQDPQAVHLQVLSRILEESIIGDRQPIAPKDICKTSNVSSSKYADSVGIHLAHTSCNPVWPRTFLQVNVDYHSKSFSKHSLIYHFFHSRTKIITLSQEPNFLVIVSSHHCSGFVISDIIEDIYISQYNTMACVNISAILQRIDFVKTYTC